MKLTKKITIYSTCLLFMIAFVSHPVSAKEIQLKLASWGSPKHFAAVAISTWVKDVNAAVAGKVKIIEYPGGQLYGPKEMHKVVAKGVVDIGVILQPRMLAMVPVLEGVYLPFAFDNMEHAARAYTGESLEIIERVLAKKRMKMIFPMFAGAVQLWSSKTNVQTLDDIQGLKILSTSPMATQIMTKIGISPNTSIPYTEQYMALKRKIADGVTTTIVSGYFQKYHEITPKITLMNITYPVVMVTMNLKKWNSLPKSVQDIMLREGEKQEAFAFASTKGWEKKIIGALKLAGASVTTLPKTEREKIKKISEKVWVQWAAKHGKVAQRLLEINR